MENEIQYVNNIPVINANNIPRAAQVIKIQYKPDENKYKRKKENKNFEIKSNNIVTDKNYFHKLYPTLSQFESQVFYSQAPTLLIFKYTIHLIHPIKNSKIKYKFNPVNNSATEYDIKKAKTIANKIIKQIPFNQIGKNIYLEINDHFYAVQVEELSTNQLKTDAAIIKEVNTFIKILDLKPFTDELLTFTQNNQDYSSKSEITW